MRSFQRIAVVGVVLSAAFFIAQPSSETQTAKAQSGIRQDRGSRGAPQTFEARLWSYLNAVYYRNWAPAAGQNADTYPGQSPHGAHLKMYLNRTAAADPDNLPHGSIIIKENFGKDKKTLMAITVMYRTKGYDADHNDWYWVKYNPDGSVARTPPAKGSKLIAGRFKSCIDCHSGAKGDDFYFANDK